MKTKQRWLPFYCQCQGCLETFELDGVVNDGHVVKLEEHPRVGHNGNGGYYHRCGGSEYSRGRLSLYPMWRYWRN